MRGRLETDHGRRRGHAADAAGAERGGHQRQVGKLVLPFHQAPQVDAPRLRAAAAIAQRLERDRHFHRPAVLEARRLHVPDAVPRLVLLVVGDRHVAQRAERVGLEDVAVAAIVEGVDREREVLVAEDVAVVAAQLVGDLALGMAVPVARADVEVDLVEQDPRLGLLGRRLPFVGLLLDEVADRIDGAVDLFIETAVDPQRRLHAERAHGDLVRRVAVDDEAPAPSWADAPPGNSRSTRRACRRARSLHVGVERAGHDRAGALDLDEDAVLARFRKSVREGHRRRRRGLVLRVRLASPASRSRAPPSARSRTDARARTPSDRACTKIAWPGMPMYSSRSLHRLAILIFDSKRERGQPLRHERRVVAHPDDLASSGASDSADHALSSPDSGEPWTAGGLELSGHRLGYSGGVDEIGKQLVLARRHAPAVAARRRRSGSRSDADATSRSSDGDNTNRCIKWP